MKRVMIIGSPGSGKSTFARKLRDKAGLPLFYLDMIKHKADRTVISSEEFDSKLMEILSQEEWIIDGNYQRTLEVRMKECDTIILFDLPTEVCIDGAKARIGTKREDLPWVETEQTLGDGFENFIEEFATIQLPKIYELLDNYSDKNVVVFKSREEANLYIKRMHTNMLGKIVTVKVDRPLGSYHPKHNDIYYQVNYGYVEGIMAGDGEEQDAYILGVDYPVEEFTGKIIAIIHRINDVEDKWIVVPEDKLFTTEQIEKQIRFQEQYFEYEIIM